MKTIKIRVFTKYNAKGSSSRYRFYNYVKCFKAQHIQLVVEPLFAGSFLNANSRLEKMWLVIFAYCLRFFKLLRILFARKRGLLIIEYELFPFFPAVFERLLRFRKIPYVVDYDDAIFHKYDKHRNGFVRFLLKNKIARVMSLAEAVIVGNGYLEDYAKKYNKNTLLLPTVVLLDRYNSIMRQRHKKPSGVSFVIGWIGSKTTSQYLLDILPVIEEFVSVHNARCHFIGFDESLLSDQIKQKCKITLIPWSEETEIQEILNFDVGIMPLRNDAWSKGKCGFKLIQYMSCKKPVIASPVGVNKNIVEDGVHGFLAGTRLEWLAAFKKIYKDKNLRKKMSENNWRKIRSEFNHVNNCKKYIGLIKNIVGYVK